MSLEKIINAYAHYNEWANKRIIQNLSSHPDDLICQANESSFGTINKTIQHITKAQDFWMHFLAGHNVNEFDWNIRDGGVSQTYIELEKSSLLFKDTVYGYSLVQLNEELKLNARWSKGSQGRYEYILHVVNHGTHHRGQIITQLRQLGITEKLLNTDYAFFSLGKDQIS